MMSLSGCTKTACSHSSAWLWDFCWGDTSAVQHLLNDKIQAMIQKQSEPTQDWTKVKGKWQQAMMRRTKQDAEVVMGSHLSPRAQKNTHPQPFFPALRHLDLPQQPHCHLHVLHYLGFLQRFSLQMNIYASTNS